MAAEYRDRFKLAAVHTVLTGDIKPRHGSRVSSFTDGRRLAGHQNADPDFWNCLIFGQQL
ncbi:MAG: hypothetical protein ACKO56_04760 [Paracoccaceae bacterium]